ncbi:MAG: CotH kinase family protein, partial [Chthoniobacteraceae bacterium]
MRSHRHSHFIVPALALFVFLTTSRAQVVISEFLASNSNSITDEDGNHEDWIELNNIGAGSVNLLGWYLTDDPSQPRKWAFPNRTMAAGSYLVVFASNKNRKPASGNLHANFRLNSSPDYLALTKDVAGGGVQIEQAFDLYPQQATDVSYGRASSATTTELIGDTAPVKALIPSSDALGATWRGGAANEPFNDSAWLAGTTGVGFGDGSAPVGAANLQQRLNSDSATDIVADTSGGAHPATNGGAAWVASNIDDAGTPRTRTGLMQFVAGENDQVSTPGHADFDQTLCTVTFWMRSAGISGSGNEAAMLWDRRTGGFTGPGTVITQHTNGKLFFQSASGRCAFSSVATVSDDKWHHVAVVMNTGASGTNSFYVDGVPSGSGTNSAPWGWTTATPIELGRSHDTYWFKYNGLLDDMRFFNRQLTPAEIMQISTGGDEPTSEEDIGLNVQAPMLGNNASAYLRLPFNVGTPADVATLRLSHRWNDGFIAYVNGSQIAAQNAPAAPTFNSASTGMHSGSIVETFDYVVPAGLLRTGGNILAIQGLNSSPEDANFLMLPKLDGIGIPVITTGYTLSPTPGAANSAVNTNVGPYVSNVTKNPDPRPTGTAASPPLTITAKVEPRLRPLAAANPVQLKYRVMFAAEQTLDMSPTGTPNEYSAQIPTNTLGAGQMLRWRVVATDNGGVTGTAPEFSDPLDNEQYYGTVAVDSSIESNLPVLYWFTPNPAAAGSTSGTRNSFFFRAPGDTGVGRFYDNARIDLHGQSSAGFAKKSYDLDFNEDNRFEWSSVGKRVKDVNLLTNWGDKSKTHNVMTHEAMAMIGGVHHWCYQVRVQQVTPVNAATPAAHFWSIADMMEDGDDDFMERNGRDPDGALYKIYDNLSGSGSAEKKTRTFENKSDLDALIAGLNPGSPILARRRFAYDNLDLPQCISYFVGLAIASSQDHGHKNYYVYRDTPGTREWSILPWDVDLSWGRNWLDASGYFTDTIFVNNDLDMYNSSQQGKGENRLYSLIVGNSDLSRLPASEFRDMVLRRLRTVLDGYFSAPNVLENRFGQLADLMDPPAIGASDADRDRAKWGTWGNDAGNTAGSAAMRYHISQIINTYLPGRRNYLAAATLAGASVPTSQPVNAADLITLETVDFNPATGNQGQEFFVVRNSNSYPVDLSGWQITGAIEFSFKPGTVLPPGGGATEHLGDLYVARDPYQFRQRASIPDDGLAGANQFRFVTGPYRGDLSARGETIELRDAAGAVVRTKAWTPAPTAGQSQLRISELNYAPAGPSAAES